MKTTQIAISIIIVLLIISGAFAFMQIESAKKGQQATTTPMTAGNVVQYSCSKGNISATFTDSQVQMVLSDGRTLTLPQTVSGSGIRYEKNGVVFVSKGSDAFLTENGTTTYADCIAGTNTGSMTGDTGAGTKTFTDSGKTFSFNYPSMFSVTGGGVGYRTDWSSGSTQLGLVLARVNIPQSFEPKTNFGDARFTVGTSADPTAVKNCLVNQNGNPTTKATVTIKGTPCTKLTYSDAGAGNRYDTTSYRTVRNSQCYTVEYTIHYGNIQNYPTGAVAEFDESKIQGILDSMAQSFSFL